jgi:hypothetical protein
LAAARLARRVAPVVAGALAVFAAGCVAKDDPEERRAALVAFVEALELEPQPGDATVRIGRTQSKSDAPYYTATGVLDEASRQSGMARVADAFEREGWDVFESGAVDFFLGACVRASRDSMVARASVGWVTDTGFNPYPRLPGRVYVQTSVGKEGSNQTFTHPDRPRCGAG